MIGLEMDHLRTSIDYGYERYSSSGKLVANYSNPCFVYTKHLHELSGARMVEVTITQHGFEVCTGVEIIDVQYEMAKDLHNQPRLFLLGGGYLVPTISK